MTAYGLIAALAWAALAAFFVRRIDVFANRWLDRVKPEHLDMATVEIPEDLMALAGNESEKWAHDQTVEAIRERYEQYGRDWNKVRAAFGIGAMH